MTTRTAERRPLSAFGRMGVVAALHAGLLLMIARGLGIVPALSVPEIKAVIIDEVRPPDEPPPPPDPSRFASRTSVDFPVPDLPPIVSDPPDTILQPPQEVIDPPPTGETFQGPVVVGVRSDSRYPLSQPPYPPGDIRAGNTGTADIEVYVLPNGRVGEARVVKSTGFPTLDRSALDEARRKWRLAPATRDGVPFAQWHRLRVVFKLNQQ